MQYEVWHPLPSEFRALAAQERRAVLLETAKPGGQTDKSLLFLHPKRELTAWTAAELDHLLEEVDRELAEGGFLAGYFHYECGEHFVGLSHNPAGSRAFDGPIAWLGVFDAPIQFDHRDGSIHGALPAVAECDPRNEAATIVSSGLQISQSEYRARIARVQEYLQAGHSYQVNFTDRITGRIEGTPLALYESLLKRQPVSFAAYVNGPRGISLSFSPEMFYRTSQGRVTVRPMKGTWPRGLNRQGDRDAEQRLLHDEKNRSEHVTIVDLLRNDLGRICRLGSVQVEKLFSVERYNTLLQMTSTISGALADDMSPARIFRTLFPSGSITGAPKRRTMEIIRELESHPRGLYTGAIGYFAPAGEACFNVAIRTLNLAEKQFTLGVGGGITADSRAEEEYEECRLKGAFLTGKRPAFSLIETMRGMGGIPLLPLHLKRLKSSADYFGVRYDADSLEAELMKIGVETESRIRLELNLEGEWAISVDPLESVPWNGRVLLTTERTESHDIFLHHKTTHRDLYDRELCSARRLGFDEVLFFNERSQITECAISSIFLLRNGRWLTPALGCGALPGIQRAVLLSTLAQAQEAELSLEDLEMAEEILVCNALRGVRRVRSIGTIEGKAIWEG